MGAVAHLQLRQLARLELQTQRRQARLERLVKGGHAIVVEARGHGAKHRHLLGGHAPGFFVALHLLGHIAQRVARALAVEFVDGHKFGEIQHVDFFQLAGGAELGRHHIHGNVHVRHDGRIALANAGGFHDDQVKARTFRGGHHVGQGGADLAAKIARGQRAHEHPRAMAPGADGIHSDAVAQQRATALAARRVDGNHRHAQSVFLVQAQTPYQLVGERRFARAAGAGDAEHGHLGLGRLFAHRLHQAGIGFAVFQGGDQLGQGAPSQFFMALNGFQACRGMRAQVLVAAHDHLADHALQAHALTIFGAVNAGHAVIVQFPNFGWHDHAAAAAKHLDVAAPACAQQVHHVFEILHVAALVGADGDALHVFLQGGRDHIVHRAVVPQVNHLRAHALQNASHDVDGGIVAIEQTGGGHKAHLVGGAVVGQGLVFSGQIGHLKVSCGVTCRTPILIRQALVWLTFT